jgi:hypothetical protein
LNQFWAQVGSLIAPAPGSENKIGKYDDLGGVTNPKKSSTPAATWAG